MKKNELDEMQLQKRNEIGTQSFILLFWMIILDTVLYGLGVKWLTYPANTFFIVIVCFIYYIIRNAVSGSLIGVNYKKGDIKKSILSNIRFVMVAVIVSIIIAKSNLIKVKGTNAQNNDIKILFFLLLIMITVGIIITIIATKKIKGHGDEQE